MGKVLVVEDNHTLADSLRDWLSKAHRVTVVDIGKAALLEAAQNQYDVIILDLGLPDIAGQEVCTQLRLNGITTPILVLTASSEVGTKVNLLDLGADDYLIKPFYIGELNARLRALLRRSSDGKIAASILTVSDLSLDTGRRFFANQAGKAAFVRNARQAHQYLRGMGYSKKEQLRGLYLNSRYQVVHDEVISVGTLTSNLVHPREVFQPAVEHGAIAIIIAHNHPSGSLEPTNADIIVTEQLLQAGKILGIELLDHLVVSQEKYVSVMDCIHLDLHIEAE